MKYYVTPSQKQSAEASSTLFTREQQEALVRARRDHLDREYDAGLCEVFASPISLARRRGEFRV
jgi:hypothetical protein